MTTAKEEWSYHSTPQLAVQFSVAKKRRRRRRPVSSSASGCMPKDEPTDAAETSPSSSILQEESPAKGKVGAEPQKKSANICDIIVNNNDILDHQHNHIQEHSGSGDVQPQTDTHQSHACTTPHQQSTNNTSTINSAANQSKNKITECKPEGFKFAFDIGMQNDDDNTSNHLKNDGSFAFGFDESLFPNKEQQKQPSKNSKKSKKKKKRKKKTKTTDVNASIMNNGRGPQQFAEVDVPNVAANEDMERDAHTECKTSELSAKQSSIGNRGDTPNDECNTFSKQKNTDTTTKSDILRPPPGFHFDSSAIQNRRSAMVNRQSMDLHRLNRTPNPKQKQRGAAHGDNQINSVDDDTTSSSNPFTFGFSIFGDGLLPPTPTSGG